MFQDITLDELQLLQRKHAHTLIDVRSPSEFHEATIPDSINIPVFTDDERAEVGTIYKQIGQKEAERRGLEIFSKKLPDFVESFRKIDTDMTVFCWRGGMRSKTAATVLDLMGISVHRLTGGIRSHRQWVVHELEHTTFAPELYVLNGFTGTGKTKLLQYLNQRGFPTIDLEKMAGHRGSIFGQIGMNPSKQKKFDALLQNEIERYKNQSFVFIEGESQRIGKVLIPDRFFQKKESGFQIFIELPMDIRVKNILEDYKPWQYPARFQEAFNRIKKRIHIPIAKQITNALDHADYNKAVHLLLEYYYDPRYTYSNQHYKDDQQLVITAKNMDDALEQLLQIAQHAPSKRAAQ